MLRNKLSIYYYVRSSTVEGKKGNLYIRVTVGSRVSTLSIPSLRLFPADYNVNRQRVNRKCDIAVQIIDFQNTMDRLLNDMHLDYERKGKIIARDDIERLIPRMGSTSVNDYPNFIKVFDEFLQGQKQLVGIEISQGTYAIRERYRKVINQAMIDQNHEHTPISNLGLRELEALQLHLLRGYKKGYAGRIMNVVNMILKYAQKRGYITDNPCNETRRIKIDRTPDLTWLEPYEVEALTMLEVSGKLEAYRDAFLFCCWTGLAIGDYELLSPTAQGELIHAANSPKDIKPGKITQEKSARFLKGKRRKTGTAYRIPLTAEAERILAKYSGVENLPFGLYGSGKHLSELAELAGIKKQIRFHTARKTFANHLLNVARVNPFYSIKIMGWSKIEEAKPYVDISDDTLAYQLIPPTDPNPGTALPQPAQQTQARKEADNVSYTAFRNQT